MAITKTRQMIMELCRETGEPDFRNYDTLLSHLLRGIKDLSIFTMPTFNYKTLPLNQYNAVDWPADCVRPMITGLCRNGRLIPLDVDDSLIPKKSMSSAATIREVDQEIDDFAFGDYTPYPLVWGAWELGEWYGYNGGYCGIGYVHHDKKERQSFIKGKIKTGDSVVFFYKSDGLEDCPDFVPSETEMALRYFVLSQYFLISKPSVAAGYREIYKEEVCRLNKFYSDASEEEWIAAMRSNRVSSPKM